MNDDLVLQWMVIDPQVMSERPVDHAARASVDRVRRMVAQSTPDADMLSFKI